MSIQDQTKGRRSRNDTLVGAARLACLVATMVGWGVLFAACENEEATGTKHSHEQLCALKVGETTKEQAIATLGKPLVEHVSGTHTLVMWQYFPGEIEDAEHTTLYFSRSTGRLTEIHVSRDDVPSCLSSNDGGASDASLPQGG